MNQTSQTYKTEKCSPYIRHIALVNIVKKTQRTLLSVIAVMISVAIIYTSLNLFVNIYQLTKTETTPDQGNYHYIVNTDKLASSSRDDYGIDDNLNLYGTDKNPDINIRTYQNENNLLGFSLVEGKEPTSSAELIVPISSNYKVGDTVTLELQSGIYNEEDLFGFASDYNGDVQEKTYHIVGKYEPSTVYQDTVDQMSCYYTKDVVDNAKHTLFIADQNVQYTDSIALVSSIFEVNENSIILNDPAIDYTTIRNYLQDTTTLLFMFIVIVILAFLISIISLKNVFITSDKDRKKEFGLLKSIGATKNDLKYLLVFELSVLGMIGAFLGGILGIGVSYIVIKLFTKQLSIVITTTMIINPVIFPLGLLIGFLMILIIGFRSYRPYLTSNPIDDLKENTYNYDPPKNKPSYSAKSFSWKMFLIYNNRLKAQSRNIFQSFTLLIMTTVLFTAILLSNTFYQIDIRNIDYDYSFSGLTASTVEASDYAFVQRIYDEIDAGNIIPKSFYPAHTIIYPDVYIEASKLNKDGLSSYKHATRVPYEETEIEGKTFGKVYFSCGLIDQHQEDELKSYYDAMIDDYNLNEGGVVMILDSKSKSAYGMLQNIQVGDKLHLSSGRDEIVKAIIYYDSPEEFSTKYKGYGTFERSIYMSYDYYVEKFGSSSVTDYIYLTLDNKATASKTTVLLEQIMNELNLKYTYENVIETRAQCKIISFILQSLLYPLFVMLFIISIININNVLIGNIHLKRGDISILKSVGMNTMQLYGFIAYEYLEGYIKGAFIAVCFFLPICIGESILDLTAAFKLGENIFATLMISLIVIDSLIIVALVALSLRNLKQIDAIENMKNIT